MNIIQRRQAEHAPGASQTPSPGLLWHMDTSDIKNWNCELTRLKTSLLIERERLRHSRRASPGNTIAETVVPRDGWPTISYLWLAVLRFFV